MDASFAKVEDCQGVARLQPKANRYCYAIESAYIDKLVDKDRIEEAKAGSIHGYI